MPVTLEAPAVAAGDGSVAPLWRVQCDHGGPGDRLLLMAKGADDAGRRAVDDATAGAHQRHGPRQRRRTEEGSVKRGPTRHHPVEDPTDPGWCSHCNLPLRNAIHDVPQGTDDEREIETRRVGERE